MLSLVCATILRVSAPAPETIQAMTFNIRYGTANDGEDRWEVRKPRALEALRKRRPDIIGLQEALDFQVEQVRAALPNYASLGVGRDDGKAKGEFSAIVYDAKRFRALRSDTFWYSETPNVPNSKHWGNNITRVCTWAYFQDLRTKKYFYFYNTHLDHQSQPSREKSVALMLERIAERSTSDPVLITGDFNVGESNPVAAQIKAKGFVDTFRVLFPNQISVGTFNSFKPEVGLDKIDYVWADSSWTVEQAEIGQDKVGGRWISDHLPVIAWVRQK